MPTLFTRVALNVKILFLLGFIALSVVGIANANSRPELSPIPTQTVFAAQSFVYRISATDSDGTIPEIRVLNSPPDATFDDNGDGSRTFRWLTPTDVPLETIIIWQAFDALDANLFSTQRMLLLRAEPGANAVPNSPPELPDIGVQFLRVDKDYQLYINPTDADNTIVGLKARILPEGAVLEDGFDGNRVLRWRPSASQTGRHEIMFVVTDAQDSSLTSERLIAFEVGDVGGSSPEPIGTSLSFKSENDDVIDNAKVVSSNGEDLEYANKQPYFESLSSLVVSAGHDISFRVIPRMPDKSAAILHVDRLPKNASFEDNRDGTRTFYWSTAESDQGEHTFRFTAIHHRNVNQRISTEVLIVIGDPTASESKPEATTGSNTAPKLLPFEQRRVAVINTVDAL